MEMIKFSELSDDKKEQCWVCFTEYDKETESDEHIHETTELADCVMPAEYYFNF
jgi:hypothetical protein